MARLIGMDEAGLGPNLGPFVVAATVWDVPSPPREFDFWRTFADVLTNAPVSKDARLHVADSKEVFQPHRGFRALEHGILSALRMIGSSPKSHDEMIDVLKSANNAPSEVQDPPPWYREEPIELPFEDHDFSIAEKWTDCCERSGVRLVAIKAAVIEPRQFNQLVRDYDNKSLVVSRVAFRLLREVWNPADDETFVVGDKHGGRNRYDELLSEILEDEMIFRLEESAELSRYRIGKTELRFQPRAEAYGPVALASMTAKYLRELAMTRFNRFWARQVEGLKPTHGYPVDAKRFHKEIADAQQKLNIDDDDLWRTR